MRCLFFNNTPAHVHLYKHTVSRLEDAGHEVLVLARSDECTEALLSYHDVPYETYGDRSDSLQSLLWEVPAHLSTIARQARQFDPDVVFGIGPYAAYTGTITRAPAVAVLDSEPSLDHVVSKPFVRAILTPEAFRKDLGTKHYRFRGFKESAYLHPDVFEADESVRADLGVDADEPYVIVRLNAFNGHHDVGKRGFSVDQRRQLLSALADHATVFVSDEGGDMALDELDVRPYDLHPARIHDALAEAELLVADTQTMVTESALLGTPAIRSNSFVGEDDMGNFLELEEHGLIDNCSEFETVLARAQQLLSDESTAETWAKRRDSYTADMVNLTEIITSVAQSYSEPSTQPATVDVTGVRAD
ncbi:hypothetical protein C482_08271 [Natrialba chahannaoensis JCM 10990]|uniref:DUF354 domain-containing protein n=1 Tax=Natrialba chahannaoensis JCM 10990 TaxID=1227492 RepID=M0AUX7_9EURY|nr:DUF354 domain-containing protein [Natrialba chahannaoensis]ELZ01179.1 hypothetical protein C482_08271 [Natrialba chahannaoensis JCM 10990]